MIPAAQFENPESLMAIEPTDRVYAVFATVGRRRRALPWQP